MPEARIFRCPNCGGDVAEGARTCRYCKAELATVRCHHCYATSRVGAVHCSGCGRELGLEPVGAGDERSCPACTRRLVAFSGTGGVLLDCSGCGGQFVEHALLTALLEVREITGSALPRRVRRERLALDPVRYLPCPACSSLMNRKNFGGESGVVVDVCSRHGTWFDDGELPRVLSFVESGGLALARANERRREREAARAERVNLAVSRPAPDLGPPADFGQELADAVVELVKWLARP